jgi:hypothetical protein
MTFSESELAASPESGIENADILSASCGGKVIGSCGRSADIAVKIHK